jgi:hypothetical protein
VHSYIMRSARLFAVPLLLAGVGAGVAPVTAAAARGGPVGPAASFTISGQLKGVAATSASNAWAVGYSGSLSSLKALILHWNGTSWTQVPSPAPAGSSLSAVATTSADSAWAVGDTGSGKTLILRWNGTAWKQVPSANPGASAGLSGVAAISANNAWAVGAYGSVSSPKTLILRWNGTSWKQVPSPSPAGGAQLFGVAAVSAGSAWAVGYTALSISAVSKTVILRWNGKAWTRVPSPSPGAKSGHADAFLYGVAAASASNAWAVGNFTDCGCGPGVPLIVHWNGKTWTRVPSPTPKGGADLNGVAAISGGAWVVGAAFKAFGTTKTLILRWNGEAWKVVPSPSSEASAFLSGVAATSASNAWAAGGYYPSSSTPTKTLILRWNGATWK